ncbi:ActS/PrrB/RegB family redox-sensitive histidine kinase [Pacificispira spongiicola]|nr:ActS/PrrB/RegB family redox-sensitive histidine kinase [Pacificispira spongiicola]
MKYLPDFGGGAATEMLQGRTSRTVGLSLSSLILVRWIAMTGQMTALLVVEYALGFDVRMPECLIAVGALAGSNLALMATRRRRLTAMRATFLMAFDILQLASLIGLTGGLQNPFALLILAPVTVAATILSRQAAAGLTVLAIAAATFVSFYHLPLPWDGGELPALYRLGIWTALTMSIAFIAAYVWTASEDTRRLGAALSESAAALAREREVSALGTLAAAAAHELGSPLATIAVVANDLMKSVPKDDPIHEDIELLKQQSDRCRDILVGLSRQPGSASDDPFETLPLSDLVDLATDKHVPDAIDLEIEIAEDCDGPEPMVRRTAEFLHGLGNFASNAGQFAKTKVTIRLHWDAREVVVSVRDDGPGFTPAMIQVLGEPYMSTRSGKDGHMGLGVFIASTLLERIGAETGFRNRGGAEILIRWPREQIDENFQHSADEDDR